jgi:heterodisulfide reductase subunit A
MEKQHAIIIGGGPAGLAAAYELADAGLNVCLIEKETTVGGHLNKWAKLFPNFADADGVRNELIEKSTHKNISLLTDKSVGELFPKDGLWHVKGDKGDVLHADSVLLATGFKTFDASKKEELGYGIYENIITSVEFEKMTKEGKILTAQGTSPKRVAFLNCVGSRDEKVGNHYCSRVCCINAVKQAVEYKEFVPNGEAFVFYMDLRMSGQFYEELYRESQEKYGVNYIRGRISEAGGTIDKRVQIKSEDTLSGLPLRITVDMLVLMVGMEASEGTASLAGQNGIAGAYYFAKSAGIFVSDNKTEQKGLFLAGTCKRPLTLPETMADARAAAVQMIDYLKENPL